MKLKIIRHLISIFGHISNTVKFRSIQFLITLSFTSVMIFTMLMVGMTLYNKFTQAAEQSAVINTRQIIDQVNLNLDYYLRNMMEISDSVKDIINNTDNIYDGLPAERMNVIINSRKDIVTLAVFSKPGEMISNVPTHKIKTGFDIKNQDWFVTPLETPANLFFSSPHVQNIFWEQHNWVMSLSRNITYNVNGKKEEGVLLVDMNFSAIDQLCQKVKLGNRGYVYIIDSEGNLVYHPQQQLINAYLKTENIDEVMDHVFGRYFDTVNGEKRLITIQTINYCRWRIVGIAYIDEIVTAQKEIGGYLIWIMLAGVLFAVMISAFISSKISHPIKELERSMKLVEGGRFDINISVGGEAEVAKLSNTFNLMVSKIRNLMEQIVTEQEAKRISELNALQAQINPHFLYNTLDSIVWMAERGKTQDAITMVSSLAKLFRISISKGRNIITVREELEHARHYLIIQKIRYKNKFNFEIEVQEGVLDCETVKLILQPIIENSIYHGIECMVDEGMIKVSVSIVNGKLLYRISDNGLGIKPEVLKNILSNESRCEKGSGVGVKNVHERIQICYGTEYGLKIYSELEVGTTVEIYLPVVRSEQSGGETR